MVQNFAERHFSRLIFGIWFVAAVAILYVSRDTIAAWKMGDPDDQMRLLEVRDWVAGQSWWDITQYRMNAPDGGEMHWSRLVDVPLGLAIVLFRPFVGQALAEQLAASLVPLLTLSVAVFMYACAARRIFDARVGLVVAALVLTLMPFTTQMTPMRIDHHGWQMVCFAAALWALFDWQTSLRSSIILGLVCALWIEISVEGLPFAALLLGISALGWIFPSMSLASQRNHQFPIALASTAIGTLLFFSITESWASPNYCDALSPVHIAALGIMAIIVTIGALLMRARPTLDNMPLRIALCGAAAVSGCATLLAVAPQCAGDAFAGLDPLVRTYWFDRTPEGLPLWKLPTDLVVQPIAYMLSGAVALVFVLGRGKQLAASDKIRLILLYAGCIAIGLFVSRTLVYAMTIANLLLAALLVDLFSAAERRTGLAARMGLRILAVFLAMPSVSAQIVENNLKATAVKVNPASVAAERKLFALARACQKTSAAAALGQMPPSAIMAGLDTNPAILQFTRHTVVASGHHRNQVAMADVIRTFTGSADEAGGIIRARKIRFVVICDGSFELALYARKAPTGMLVQLRTGQLPAWLQRRPDIGPFQIFEVNQAMLPQFKRTS